MLADDIWRKLVQCSNLALNYHVGNDMLADEINRKLTKTDQGTGCGSLMRLYWQPVALTDELVGNRPVVPVRIFGEDLVLFRNGSGEIGLIDRHCPHRQVDLCYGRLEENGLRCPFHGWLFAPDGTCLDQPGELPENNRVRHFGQANYPCIERNGMIFAYLGPGDPPPLPAVDCLQAPDSHVFAFKGFLECNYLQAVEVGIDPAHASFLHRYLQDEDTDDSYGRQFRSGTGDDDIPVTWIMRNFPAPTIDVKRTNFGLQIEARRHLDDSRDHVRVTNLLFPNAIVIPMSSSMAITQWHVPVDDHNCYWYAHFTSYDKPVDKPLMREQRMELYKVPDYKPWLGRFNNWGYDPAEQESETYTGMGMDINVHDQWAVESPGPITDRSKEHLAGTDVAISRYRSMLLRAMDIAANPDRHGELPLYRAADGNSLGPEWHDSVMTANCPREEWLADYQERRDGSGW